MQPKAGLAGPFDTFQQHARRMQQQLKLFRFALLHLQSSGSVKSLAKSVSAVSLKGSDSKADLVQDQSPRTVTGVIPFCGKSVTGLATAVLEE